MRMTRRGCFGKRGGAKYVWAVYTVESGYHADESTTPYTGKFTISRSTYYKMAAKAYTATSTTFTLKNPVQTTRANLAIGDYLVNVSTSSSTATSGSYLYKITAISGNTFTYTRWSPTAYEKKVGAELYRVESGTMDYPIDGPQGNLWYVMIKGEYPVYVWNQYNAVGQYQQRSSSNQTVRKERNTWVTVYSYGTYYGPKNNNFADCCTFDPQTGIYTLRSGYTTTSVGSFNTYVQNGGKLGGAWMINATSGATAYHGASGFADDYAEGVTVYTSVFTYTQTDYIGTVESYDQSAYPQNGVQGGYWYTYSHSYIHKFDNT